MIQKVNYIMLAMVVFMGFFMFGISENVKGPAIPRIQLDFKLNEVHLGLLLALNSLGYLLACGYTGWLSRKIGLKFANILCFVAMFVSGFLIYISPNYATFAASYFLMYIGNGMLEITLGIIAAKVFTKNTGTMMNLSHFFYGLSSTFAPIVAASIMNANVSGNVIGWRGMYLISLSLSAIPIIPALLSKFPSNSGNGSERVSIGQYMKQPVAWLIVFILSFGVTAEMAVGGWLVNFLEKSYNFNPALAAGYMTSFFFCFMLARLLLGPFIDKIGFVKSLLILSCFAGITIVTGVIIGKPAAFLLAVSGIGIAPIYPTVMALLAKLYPENIDTAMTFTLIVMGITIVIGNFLVGAITDLFKLIFTTAYGAEKGISLGYSAGYMFIGICCLICFAGTIILLKRLKKDNKIL
ncbi:MAG: MFS transporter [Clostridiaceae bacterium]|nr:MFS transporter [Clostridiaceae bacterium]